MADESISTSVPVTGASSDAIEGGNMDPATNKGHTAESATVLAGDSQSTHSQSARVEEPSAPLQPVNGHTAITDNKENPDGWAETVPDISEPKTAGAEMPVAPSAPKKSLASGKRATNGSAKRRSSGVPEHKNKNRGKKKAKPTVLHLDAKPGALFLARMKGHQPWPSIICDEDMLPAILIQTRPITAAQADGSFKKPEYADGGKRASERTFPVMFLLTNEFAWIPNTDLSAVTKEKCIEEAKKQKGKTLAGAYGIASEGHDLSHFKKVLLEHQEMLNAEAEAKAEREAKKAEKATKQKRKSDVALSSGDDKMDIEGEAEKGKTKKRKKETSADDDEKPAKTQKTGTTKLKLNMTPKTPVTESTKKKTPKTKSNTRKATAKAGESEDDETTKLQEEVLSPAQVREKREKEVRYIRHKLQKGFLSRDTVPGEDEIEAMSSYLSKMETHPDLESSILRATKIHKVLKAMIRLDSIPMDDEYQFKKRSRELLDRWYKTLALDPTEEDSKADGAGTKKDEHEKTASAVSGDEKAHAAAEATSAAVQIIATPVHAQEQGNEASEGKRDARYIERSESAKQSTPKEMKEDALQPGKASESLPAEPRDLEEKA